jgi:hypothetical protein
MNYKNPQFIFLTLIFAIAFACFFYPLKLPIAFLRAENGLLFNAVYSSADEFRNFSRSLLLNSYNGHFTPVMFSLEMLQSKLFGTHELPWLIRQLIVVGILGACIFRLFYEVLISQFRDQKTVALLSFFAATFFLCQPIMLSLVTWPLLSFQFVMIAMGMYVVMTGFTFTQSGDVKQFRNFLIASYFTMQVFGAGIALSLTALLLGSILVYLKWQTKDLNKASLASGIRWLMLALLLTLGHAYLMMRNIKAPSDGLYSGNLLDQALRFGWLFIESLQAGLGALWGNASMLWPSLRSFETQASYGLGLFMLGLGLCVILIYRFLADRSLKQLGAFFLFAFPFGALSIHVALVVLRLSQVSDRHALLLYVVGDRYVIFPSMYVLLLGLALCFVLIPLLGRLLSYLALILGVSALVSSFIFAKVNLAAVWPTLLVNTEVEWREVVAKVKIQHDMGEPIDDISMEVIDPEFKFLLSQRPRLIEHELGCRNCVRFKSEHNPIK